MHFLSVHKNLPANEVNLKRPAFELTFGGFGISNGSAQVGTHASHQLSYAKGFC